MGLLAPKYLQIAGIQDNSIHYKWDEWNIEQADGYVMGDRLCKRLRKLSYRANMAFTIATAEWIVHRYGTLSDDPLPIEYLEAAWAQIVNFRYSFHRNIRKEEWSGPVRGPIGIALRRVIFAIEQAEEHGDPSWRAARISNLAEYVMTDPMPFQEWRKNILERMEKLYRLNPEEMLGEVVPREALDPSLEFKIDHTESLINRFLAGLDYKSNHFLISPEKMLEQGFEGTPYVFDIEKDRKKRFEW